MQPTDAKYEREYYITDPNYIGMPKRDGNKIVVTNEDGSIFYQSRAGNLQSTPDQEIERTLKLADNKFLDFILEGEKVYYDWEGKEHRTGAQAAKTNIRAGHPEIQPRICLCFFDCLLVGNKDITYLSKQNRWEHTREIVSFMQMNSYNYDNFELVDYVASEENKRKLCERQVTEGREGEIWALRMAPYAGGKNKTNETIVRTKYLKKIVAKITGLTPTTAQGRPFGAIEISLNGIPVGSVGTGYTVDQMWDIHKRFQAGPVNIHVVTQGFTEDDQVMHGRFKGFAN
jgi:bifunctional non-homologous end joining protein LigD